VQAPHPVRARLGHAASETESSPRGRSAGRNAPRLATLADATHAPVVVRKATTKHPSLPPSRVPPDPDRTSFRSDPLTGGVHGRPLTLSRPSDPAEVEADAVAAQVVAMPNAQLATAAAAIGQVGANIHPVTPAVRRKCACQDSGASCDSCKEQQGEVQRAADGPRAAAAPAAVDSVLRSGGRPLDAATRSFMEPRFGHDFSDVRLHLGGAAEQSATDLDARAYTVGRHIVFGRGHYKPSTNTGRHLLAHELTHVVQQQAAGAPTNGAAYVARSVDETRVDTHGDQAQGGGGTTTPGTTTPGGTPTGPAGATGGTPTGPAGATGATGPAPGATGATCACEKQKCGSGWVPIPGTKICVSPCQTATTLNSPNVLTPGTIATGTTGMVGLTAGAYEITGMFDWCESNNPDTKGDPNLEIGLIQTVEHIWWGGVYFDRPQPAGAPPDQGGGPWQPVDRTWTCATNSRDCCPPGDGHCKPAPAPWWDDAAHTTVGLQAVTPVLTDEPKLTRLPIFKGKFPLRRMRIDAVFHSWLIARHRSTGAVTFLHNWNITGNIVATLADDGHPLSHSAWTVLPGLLVPVDGGPGKGSFTPVLTGTCANDNAAPC
jgi:hypothetical protein